MRTERHYPACPPQRGSGCRNASPVRLDRSGAGATIEPMDVAPLATLAGLLLLKEAGLPIPVPGDILVLGAGAATSGRPEAAIWLLVILAAGYVGGTIQFLLVRGAMRRPLLTLLARLGVPRARLDGLAQTLCARGAKAVAGGRATPGLRVATIAASGVAALPLSTFVPGLIAGNTVFVGGHFALGFILGKPALGIAAGLGNPVVVAGILVALSALGALAFLLIRRRRRAGEDATQAGFTAWADAACPVCLTLTAARSVLAAPERSEVRAA